MSNQGGFGRPFRCNLRDTADNRQKYVFLLKYPRDKERSKMAEFDSVENIAEKKVPVNEFRPSSRVIASRAKQSGLFPSRVIASGAKQSSLTIFP